jgi:hypothetical protein
VEADSRWATNRTPLAVATRDPEPAVEMVDPRHPVEVATAETDPTVAWLARPDWRQRAATVAPVVMERAAVTVALAVPLVWVV